MRLYLAGPMSGLPEFNFPAFHARASALRLEGHTVLNPAELDGGDTSGTWAEYLRRDLALLLECEAVAVLPGWEKSRGANLEVHVARSLEMPVLHADTLAPVTETILQEAQRLVHGDRGAAYGHPLDDYTRTGALWGAILHEWAKIAAVSSAPRAIPAHLAVLCMAAMKISREVNRHGRDNLTDLAGYAECAMMVAEEEARRNDEREAA